ncbi:MAG: hypothetical protein ACXWQO_08550 [Bdellovibrionota bacterium]
MRAFQLTFLLFLFVSISAFAAGTRGEDPAWNEYVVGKVEDLPDSPIKKFLHASHFNNAYGDSIKKKTAALGPFSPQANNVFWIPHIEMPMTPENWRFLSSMENVPDRVIRHEVIVKNGVPNVRMFLHPFSLQEKSFIKMAEKNGGFKFEYQAATTASVRSFIAWKTGKPKPEGTPGKIDFPDNTKDFIWPKVSITSMDIDGSRLNPAKKMVRAAQVTQLMGAIPQKVKDEVGFDFAGEWTIGVPDKTDAGFATREILDQYVGKGAAWVEPGFSTMSPDSLSAIAKGAGKNADKVIENKILTPMNRVIAYLLMEEGMIGENHNQNMSFPKNRANNPIDEILLHDADSFRTSIILRALNGKDNAPLRKIETPFFFMKDSMFRATGAEGSEDINLNALVHDYIVESADSSTVTGSILNWCKKIKAYKSWCTKKNVTNMVAKSLADALSPYVGREISPSELKLTGESSGSVGLVKIFKERLQVLAAKSPAVNGKVDPDLQKVLLNEYQRLYKIGLAGAVNTNVSATNTDFILNVDGENSFISAITKATPNKPATIKGIALLGPTDDDKALKFAKEVKEISGIKIPMTRVMITEKGLPANVVMQNIGGGINNVRRPADKDAGIAEDVATISPAKAKNCGLQYKSVGRAARE